MAAAETTKKPVAAPAPPPPVRVIETAAPADEEPKHGGPDPDFDALVAAHAREQREAKRAAKAAEQQPPTEGTEEPPQEVQADAAAEPEQEKEPEGEKPAEEQAPAEQPPAADDVKTIDEAKEVLRLAREDPRAFAAKYVPTLFSRQFAALSRQEADLRQREQQIKSGEQLVAKAQELMRAAQNPDPAELLSKWFPPGFYDRLTRYMLNNHKVAPEDQIDAQRRGQDAIAERLQEMEHKITASEWRGTVRGLLVADKYAPLRDIEDVVDKLDAIAAETLRQGGRLLQPHEAADMLLNELKPQEPDEGTLDTWLNSPTVRASLEKKLGIKPAGTQGPPKTVTSPQAVTGQKTLTEKPVAPAEAKRKAGPLLREDDEESFATFLATEQR